MSYGRLEVVSGHEDGKRAPKAFPFTIINALFFKLAAARTLRPRDARANDRVPLVTVKTSDCHTRASPEILRCMPPLKPFDICLHIINNTSGIVIVWWLSTGMVMLKSKVHSGPVRQLQFDATKVYNRLYTP